MEQGILMVSFGTSYPEARSENIRRIAAEIREKLPGKRFYQAYIAGGEKRFLKDKMLEISSPEEAFSQMRADGIEDVVLTSTAITEGKEYDLLLALGEKHGKDFRSLQVVPPLLYKEENFEEAAFAIWQELREYVGEDPLIFMAHSTTEKSDAAYLKMESFLRTMSRHPVYIATVRGKIKIEDVLERMRRELPSRGRVLLAPFTVAAGEHAHRDMAGRRDSFTSKCRAVGLHPESLLKGVGDFAGIRALYVRHLKQICEAKEPARAGVLYGVGVGPGDPELMTLKAVRVLKECNALVFSAKDEEHALAYRICRRAVPELERKPRFFVPFHVEADVASPNAALSDPARTKSMQPAVSQSDAESVFSHEAALTKLEELLQRYRRVGFPVLGDPSIYSSFSYVADDLKKQGYRVRYVSGVASFLAAAASGRTALAQGQETIEILPWRGAWKAADKPQEASGSSSRGNSLQASAAQRTVKKEKAGASTRIYMKAGEELSSLKKKLMEEEKAGGISVLAITKTGMDGQSVARSAAAIDENAGYLTTVIVKQK